MYSFKLVTRNCTSEACPSLMPQNRSPQTGISFAPRAARRRLPRIAVVTWSDGYLPPFFFASAVRSDGRHLQRFGSWAVALSVDAVTDGQYAVYISVAEVGEVALIGTCLISFCWAATKKARHAMRPMMGNTLRTSIMTSSPRHWDVRG